MPIITIPLLVALILTAVSGWAQQPESKTDFSIFSFQLQKAADSGDADAQALLGLIYQDGRGVTSDFKEAVKWFSASASQGNANGQFWLGKCYANGRGVGKDYKEAVKWLTKSAEQGNDEARKALYEIPIGAIASAEGTLPPIPKNAEIVTTSEQKAKAFELQKSYPLTTCVVSHDALGGMGETIDALYDGKLVRFCCKGCVKSFNKNPDKYLKVIDAAKKPAA